MYFGGSVVGKASTVGIAISPTPPLIFTGGSKSAKFGVTFNFEPPVFENEARYSEAKVQCCDDCPMSLPSLVKFGPRTLDPSAASHAPPPKIARKTC